MSDHMTDQLRTWSPGQAVTPGECAPGCEGCKPACGCVHDSPDFVPDAQKALEARGFERVNRHAPAMGWDERAAEFRPPPAPPAEATRMDALAALDRRAGPGADEAPPAEAKGDQHRRWGICALNHTELTREEFATAINRMAVSAHGIAKVLAHDDSLRARARKAGEREAKWRRELSAACELSERAREIVITALNQPPEHFYDKHDNGEWSAEHIAFAIRSLFRERDEARRLTEVAVEQLAEAREQHDLETACDEDTVRELGEHLRQARSERDEAREQLAKETERADKEYERCELWKRTTDDVAMERDALRTDLATERAARVKAEEYKDRLRGECVGTLTDVGAYMLVDSDPTAPGEVASAIRRVARERDQNAARLAAAEAELDQTKAILKAGLEKKIIGHVKLDDNGRPVITHYPTEIAKLTERLAVAEARIARLVRAGDDLARWVDPGQAVQGWAAAKADAPAVCKDGLPHSWGTDGQHANEFCKVCYVDRPKRAPAAGGGR